MYRMQVPLQAIKNKMVAAGLNPEDLMEIVKEIDVSKPGIECFLQKPVKSGQKISVI